jgi:hypothetical protein
VWGGAAGNLSVKPRKQIRAPAAHEAVVAEPPLSEVGAVLASNRRLLDLAAAPLLGRPWPDLRRQARRAVLGAAADYLRRAGEPVPDFTSESLILAGHQPELFHPGVWVKNFALNGLARAHGLTPVNLVVDNDTNKSSQLKVPARGADIPVCQTPGRQECLPHVVALGFDHWASEVPYEERPVRDEGLFASLPERAAPFFRDWPEQPMLPAFWDEVLRQAKRTPLLGERLAAARRTWERRWGCHNFEVPVSAVCRTEPFDWFAAHLLGELPRFHADYNGAVHDYRRQYDIHSRNHPVPDLARQDDWLEAPFWAWRAGQERRGRLMVRVQPDRVELRVGSDNWPSLPPPAREPRQTVAALQELEWGGLKVRSRALTNTLFARLFLSDLFIHGIGGGKYDELTDEICRRFYGVRPPRFLVLSATLLLPLPRPAVSAADVAQLERHLRDLHYNPQRHLGPRVWPEIASLVEQKATLIDQAPSTRPERARRFRELRQVNDRLEPFVAHDETEARERLKRMRAEVRLREVVDRRDYAICLHPEEELGKFCTSFLTQ